jgi:hypothetical protein
MADLFWSQPVTLADMLGCAKRELAMRENVYPRWVAAGKMTQQKADLELRYMRAIVSYLDLEINGIG